VATQGFGFGFSFGFGFGFERKDAIENKKGMSPCP
jgi:hypothetical protein